MQKYAMEVLNLATTTTTPLSLHRNKKPRTKKLHFRLPKQQNHHLHATLLTGFLSFSSSLTNASFARALTYEEAISQTVTSSNTNEISIDIPGFIDSFLKFASENPLIIGGGALVIAVPLIVTRFLGSPKPWGVVSAKSAYAKLSEEGEVQLLDIREGKEVREVGTPDVSATKKKTVSVTYNGDDKSAFLKKIGLRLKDPGNTTLLILDKFDGNSELVAELVTANGFKAAFAIKDGAEGPRGWVNSGLPWKAPNKASIIDFGGLQDAISSAIGDTDGLPLTLGLAAVTGLGLLAFTEIEALLELLGSAAIVQLVANKFLFAEDRKKTLKQVDEFLNSKVAPMELVDEIKMIGKALLPTSGDVKSLPAPTEGSPTAFTSSAPAEATTVVAESTAEVKAEVKVDAPAPVNSAPVAAEGNDSLPARPTPLSPYPNYPDLKPPSSPAPSTP